jgi:hypothetical protein
MFQVREFFSAGASFDPVTVDLLSDALKAAWQRRRRLGGRNVRLMVENFGGYVPAACALELVHC